MTEPIPVTILGATGSIGAQTLEVIAASSDRFRVVGLAAGSNVETLVAQARAHRPERVAVSDPTAAAEVRKALPEVDVLDGPEASRRLAEHHEDNHVVLNGIVGSRGLQPTLAALQAGNRVALANKESLIVGGELVLDAARGPVPGGAARGAASGHASGGEDAPERARGTGELRSDRLIPVDSEHSALAQCLRGGSERELSRLLVTASGGPFRGWSQAALERVTVADALAHPTWDMGAVITVNSATLANKGLEVIEAHLLFGIPYDAIEVVVHPQSVVHGMVEFHDGATMAKLSPPDMRLPIQLALAWPERLDHAPARMDWSQPLTLQFEPVDTQAFPMLDLAVSAGRRGSTYPGVYNAANEEAVAAFLAGRLDFLGIARVVETVLAEHEAPPAVDLAAVLDAEEWGRRRARALMPS